MPGSGFYANEGLTAQAHLPVFDLATMIGLWQSVKFVTNWGQPAR